MSSIDIPVMSVRFPPPEIPFSEDLKFGLDWMVDLKIDEKQKLAFGITTVSITPLENKTIMLASLQTACGFEFENFDEVFFKSTEGEISPAAEVEITIKTAAYSTTRGILFAALKGTYLHSTILPLANLQEIILRDRERLMEAKAKNSN